LQRKVVFTYLRKKDLYQQVERGRHSLILLFAHGRPISPLSDCRVSTYHGSRSQVFFSAWPLTRKVTAEKGEPIRKLLGRRSHCFWPSPSLLGCHPLPRSCDAHRGRCGPGAIRGRGFSDPGDFRRSGLQRPLRRGVGMLMCEGLPAGVMDRPDEG
jgi:hypothetical protein